MLTDIHVHILPGLDDGASSVKESERMLREAQKNNISRIIATPHALPGVEPFDLIRFYDGLRSMNGWLKENGASMKIYPGSEIYYTDDTLRMLSEERIPTLAGTRNVLLEFSPRETYERIRSAVVRLGGAGYSVVIAHAERYGCLRKSRCIVELREEYQATIQVNARTILEPAGLLNRMWLKKALDEGWIDIIASDAHNVSNRNNLLLKAYEQVSQWKGAETAMKLFCSNANRIIPDTDQRVR